MKTNKLLIRLVCFSLLGTAFVALPTTESGNVASVEASFVGEVKEPFTKTTYYIDEEINVSPKDIVYKDKTYTCTNFYVKYPDGSQKRGSTFRLNQTGEYNIVYVSDNGGVVIEAIQKVFAYKKSYSTGKDTSSSEYVDKIICEQNNPTGGIQTYLAEGDTWTYNQAIDISKADLSQPIIKYYTRQSSELAEHVSLDVNATIIRLTDFYDETNYIDIYNTYNETNPSTHRMQPYVTACAPGQVPSGIDLTNRSSKTISYEGVTYYLHNSNRAWGACLDTVPGRVGIYGTEYSPDIANSDNRGFSVFYDYAKKSIYVQHKSLHVVTDLDEPAIYSQTLFKGFTTGEVILSVRCDGYQESLGFFEVSEIYGKKGSALNSDYAYDETAPVITLSNNADNFYIAKDEPFELFAATASDPHIVGGVNTQVYYDYGTANQRFVPIVDGKFMPTYVGQYTVVYTAKDTFGNIATRTVTCNSITTANNSIISLDFAPVTNADAGTKVHFEQPIVNGYNEGLYYKVSAINQVNNDVTELDNNNLDLFLKYAGQYKIRVEYGDISCKRVADFDLTSNPSNNAYLGTTLFPQYFIKGAKHSLDDNKVVLCKETTPTYASGSVYIKEDGKSEYEISPIDPREFEVYASNSVQFKYVYENNTIFESEVIPVVDVNFGGNLDITKYFVGEFNNVANDDGLTFAATSSEDAITTQFVNPVAFSIFRCEGSLLAKTGYKTIDVVLSDYNGVAEDFVISLYYSGSVLGFVANGVKGEIGQVDDFSISYDSLNKALSLGNGVSISLENPFKSDKVYLSFRASNVRLEAGEESKDLIILKQLNNQVISSDVSYGDFTGGQVGYTKLKGQRNINTVVTIDKSVAFDILSPYLVNNHKVIVTYKENVEAKDSKVVTSVDGVSLNGNEDVNRSYDVLLDKHGVYYINYVYEDQNFNVVNITEIIYVDDNEAPEISLNSTATEVIKLGEEITLRDYTVKDESDVKVTIYAVSPTNEMIRLSGKKFTPTEKGDWHIVYYAKDANANVNSVSYVVRVK